MKKIVLISIYLSLFLGGYFLDKFLQSPGIMSQTMSGELVIAPTATTPENITIGNLGNVKLGNQDGWNIFVKDIALKYDPVTRNISGYYTLENFDEKGLDTVYIQSLLVIPRIQADYPPMYFDSRTTPPFTLPGKSELKREFTYNVRE